MLPSLLVQHKHCLVSTESKGNNDTIYILYSTFSWRVSKQLGHLILVVRSDSFADQSPLHPLHPREALFHFPGHNYYAGIMFLLVLDLCRLITISATNLVCHAINWGVGARVTAPLTYCMLRFYLCSILSLFL